MLVKWQRLTERFKISDRIALFALLIALIPFLDLISRKVTVADIEVLPPIRVNFRTSDLAYKGKIDGEIQRHRDDGTGIVSKEETGDLSTYAILPLSYINRGDAGEDFLVPLEQLQVKIDNQSFMYDAAYTTKMVPRKSPSWIGETSPRLPAVLSGGRARSDQVVFIPTVSGNADALSWVKFIEILTEHREDMIQIVLEVKTLSGKVFQSVPCQISANQLLRRHDQMRENQMREDREGYYYVVANCKTSNQIHQ